MTFPGAPRWRFPDPSTADADGVVGFGADLQPDTLLHAYRQGIFPWPHPGMPLPWCSPDPRGVLPLDGLRVSRSLRQRLRRCGFHTTVDRSFAAVVEACAASHRDEGTWILPQMRAAYLRLHLLGHAHSLEVWRGRELVGGLYGVGVGAVFAGESMFHRTSDASKVALVDLVARLAEAGGWLIDVQLTTPHLASLGARPMPRADFLALLRRARDMPVSLTRDRLPVARLAPPARLPAGSAGMPATEAPAERRWLRGGSEHAWHDDSQDP
ncbi:MAG TPA: leucyl/phenylalanyl-tRNA--protein transferase [Actinomycetes bacterium]|jgi:leucyl/phenylalanyl-tRNA--protein transferase|nr:leucyl/phenylalanyl-tRNA--protein transferase [Actinomycetes bacterium]